MLIEIEGLDGSKLAIDPESIIRVRYLDPRDANSGTSINYGGGVASTKEKVGPFLKRVETYVTLIQFTTRIGTPVWINPPMVSTVAPAPPQNAPGTELQVGGLYQHVIETYEEVIKKLGKAIDIALFKPTTRSRRRT